MSDIVPVLTKKENTPPDPLQIENALSDLSKNLDYLSGEFNAYTDVLEKNNKVLEKNSKDKVIEKEPVISSQKDSSEYLKEASDYTSKLKENFFNATSKTVSFVEDTFLGDTSFITQPFKQLGDIAKSMGGFVGGIFHKKRVPPKRSAMLKTNPEAVYITDTLLGADKKKGSILDKILGFKGLIPMLLGAGAIKGIMKSFGKSLLKIGAVGLIVGGLVLMAVDGIKGYFKAKEWGTSKVAAVIGGALAGTGEGGWKQAFKNMGKGAMIGAGSGFLIGGPVGALIGGLVGGAIFGIMGYFGGKTIAQGIDKVIDYVVNNPAILGAGVGALAGLALFGPVGMVVGALLGTALGALIENITKSPLDIKSAMGMAMKDPRVSALAGAAIGGAAGFVAFGPVGFLAGALLGAALGGLAGSILGNKLIKGQVSKAIKAGDTSTLDQMVTEIDELTDMRSNLFKGLSKEDQEYLKKRYKSRFTAKEAVNIQKDNQRAEQADILYDQLHGNVRAQTQESPSGGTWNPITRTYTSVQPHNDVIMRPDGSVHETHPDDILIATKNPVGLVNKQTAEELNGIQDSYTKSELQKVVSLLSGILNKPESKSANNNVIQQNFTSRFTPENIMATLTTEVL